MNNEALTKFQALAADGTLSSIMYQFTEYLKENCLCKGEKPFAKALQKLCAAVQFAILKWVFTHRPARREDSSNVSE